MSEHAKDPRYGRNTFFYWLEYNFNRARFWTLYYWSFVSERFTRIGWTITFSILFLYFVYSLCFIDESQRMTDESTRVAAFIMLLLMMLSSLKNSRFA